MIGIKKYIVGTNFKFLRAQRHQMFIVYILN